MPLLLAIVVMLLAVAAILLVVVVLVSFSIACQVRRQGDPAMAARSAAMLPVGRMLREFACLLFTLLQRPLGWLPPRMTPGAHEKPPVLLLHGLFQNRSCLRALQRRLQKAGYRTMSINTPPWHDLATLTARVAHGVDCLRSVTGADRVHLVGHSMGGILARSYLQQFGDANVAGCVTLGAPHAGSQLAIFAVTRLGRALLPGSAMLARLNAAPLPAAARCTAIFSSDDNIIVPADSARLAGADNIELRGMGHTAMLFSPRVAETVVSALAGTTNRGTQPVAPTDNMCM